MSLIHGIVSSLRHAIHGVFIAVKTEQSFRIHLAATLFVSIAAIVLPLSSSERIVLALAIAAVLVLELLNSTVERLVDLVKPRMHSYVGEIKDLMAASVLIASFFSVVVGVLIFLPYVRSVIERL